MSETQNSWVSHSEAIQYGISLLIYIVMYGLLAGVFLWGGVYLAARGNTGIAFISTFIGVILSIAGFIGIFYKVIADGVYTAIRNAGVADEPAVASEGDTGTASTGELNVSSSYDEANEELNVIVDNPGGARFLDILVGGEKRKTLSSPEAGDSVTVSKKPSESVEVKRRNYGT